MFTLSQAANVVYLRSASSQLTCLAGVICERNVRDKEKTQVSDCGNNVGRTAVLAEGQNPL